MASITKYTDRITSEHNDKPNFMATVAALVQPIADISACIASMPAAFDLDLAVGAQLDVVGLWVGRSRQLEVALEGVYFSFGYPLLGFGQGTWKGPFDPTTGLVSLPDDSYRRLLRARIANNHWDGTIPNAYGFLSSIFDGATVFIQDYGNMTMLTGVVGPITFDAVTMALLTRGYLDVKPAGVHMIGYAFSSVEDSPIFGFGAQNTTIAGFGSGAWANII